MATIVVGIDGSESSRNALRWAVEEAKLRRASVVAVHVWAVPDATMYGGLAVTQNEVEALAQDAREFVEHAVEEAVPDAVVDVTPIAVEGNPATALIAAARSADLLVVGSRGLGGFKGLLLGSVSQRVAHHAPCPVVVIGTNARVGCAGVTRRPAPAGKARAAINSS
jgi:nucleotide-binding universal stress UspA family protein